MHHRNRLLAATVFITVPFLGCGDRTSSNQWPGSIDTLPSGVVLVENPSSDQWPGVPAWTAHEDLRIGTVEGRGPDVFGSIEAFGVRADGSIFILDSQAQEIRVFDSAGQYVRTIGRRGSGPGEFQGATGLAFGPLGDLWVVDYRNVRYSRFDQEGNFVTSFRRSAATGSVYPWLGGVDPSGHLWDIGLEVTETVSGLTRMRQRGAIRFHPIRLNTDFSSADTLPPVEYQPDFLGPLARPFGGRLTFSFNPNGYFWIAHTSEYRLHQRTVEGDTLRVVTLPLTPVPVTDTERDSVVASFRDVPFVTVRDDDIPEFKPVLQRLVTDDAGRLYVFPVTEPELEGRVVDVFQSDGVYQGRMTLPVTFALGPGRPLPLFRGRHAYAVTTDELDVQYLVRVSFAEDQPR